MSYNHGFIYLTTNLINNKKYIGLHRYNAGNGENYFGSGKLISQAIIKYGKSNFKKYILYIAHSEEELLLAEQLFICSRNAVKNDSYYNLIPGGKNPVMFGEQNPMFGKRPNEFISEEKYEDWKKKLDERNSNISGENNPMFGKTFNHTENTKKKISESMKGLQVGGKNGRAKKVKVIFPNGDIKIYGSIAEAGIEVGSPKIIKNLIKSNRPYDAFKSEYKYLNGIIAKFEEETK